LRSKRIAPSPTYRLLPWLLLLVLALILFNQLVHISSALFGSSVTYLIPVVALLWGLLDMEAIGLTHLIGMLVILTEIFLISRSK
jgi:drug/metabolite transporter (DMT)-like permease